MMNERFFKRIGYDGKLEDISEKICADFGMGKLVENKIVAIGYEDFNFILKTDKGDYFVKVFKESRSDNDCKRIVDINEAAMKNGVAVPRLIDLGGKYLNSTRMNELDLRFCVFEYIEGENLFALKGKYEISEDDIRFLSRQAALIDSLDIKPEFIYDDWAITNLAKEFKDKGKYLEKEDYERIEELVREFEETDFEKLPHCFVHGDILSQNVVRDKSGKLWIIDFSVSNYYPRIQELAVFAGDIIFDQNDERKSEGNLKIALEEYQKIIKLTKEEIDILPLYIKFAFAMDVLLTNYEKVVEKNHAEENEFFLKIGRAGLKINS